VTVSELIGELMAYPHDAEVRRFETLWGSTEVGYVYVDDEGRVVVD
jgi:hypothetical protein